MEKHETASLASRLADMDTALQNYSSMQRGRGFDCPCFLFSAFSAHVQSAKAEKADDFLVEFEKSYRDWSSAEEDSRPGFAE